MLFRSFFFDFENDSQRIENIEFGLPGLHNVENATAAIQAALLLGVDPEKIKAALKDFRGVKRRFEYVVKNEKHIFIDDYAHHPEELRACISGVRSLYPDKKLTVVFQPHLFSRTRDFVEGFAEVLNTVDELVLLDIYPARELPIEGVTSEIISERMSLENRQICRKDAVPEFVRNKKPELLLTVGAGDIDTLVLPIKEILENA